MAEPERKEEPKPRSVVMTALKVVGIVVLVAILAFVGVGFFGLSGKYDVAREVTIKALPEKVHEQVGDLREWPNWLPFVKHDKTIKTEIEKPTGVGAHQHWKGDSGVGELTFTSSDEQKGIEFDMLFDKTIPSKGSITYEKSGEETKVTWRMHGENKDFMGKYFALLMPSMMGPMFDEGLADLKKKVEAE